jgi:hypothetical protein
VQSLPASTFQDVKDILSGVYEKVEEGEYKSQEGFSTGIN